MNPNASNSKNQQADLPFAAQRAYTDSESSSNQSSPQQQSDSGFSSSEWMIPKTNKASSTTCAGSPLSIQDYVDLDQDHLDFSLDMHPIPTNDADDLVEGRDYDIVYEYDVYVVDPNQEEPCSEDYADDDDAVSDNDNADNNNEPDFTLDALPNLDPDDIDLSISESALGTLPNAHCRSVEEIKRYLMEDTLDTGPLYLPILEDCDKSVNHPHLPMQGGQMDGGDVKSSFSLEDVDLLLADLQTNDTTPETVQNTSDGVKTATKEHEKVKQQHEDDFTEADKVKGSNDLTNSTTLNSRHRACKSKNVVYYISSDEECEDEKIKKKKVKRSDDIQLKKLPAQSVFTQQHVQIPQALQPKIEKRPVEHEVTKEEQPIKRKKLSLHEYNIRRGISSSNSAGAVNHKTIRADMPNTDKSSKCHTSATSPSSDKLGNEAKVSDPIMKQVLKNIFIRKNKLKEKSRKSDDNAVGIPPSSLLNSTDKVNDENNLFDPIKEASRKMLMNIKKKKAAAMRKRNEDIVMSKIPKVDNLQLQPLMNEAEVEKILSITKPTVAVPEANEKPQLPADYERIILVSVGVNTDENMFQDKENHIILDDRHSKLRSPVEKRDFKFTKTTIVRDYDVKAEHGEDKVIIHLEKYRCKPTVSSATVQTNSVSEFPMLASNLTKQILVSSRRNDSDMTLSSGGNPARTKEIEPLKQRISNERVVKSKEVRTEGVEKDTKEKKRSSSKDRSYRRRSKSVSRGRRKRSRSRSLLRSRDRHRSRGNVRSRSPYHKRRSPSVRRERSKGSLSPSSSSARVRPYARFQTVKPKPVPHTNGVERSATTSLAPPPSKMSLSPSSSSARVRPYARFPTVKPTPVPHTSDVERNSTSSLAPPSLRKSTVSETSNSSLSSSHQNSSSVSRNSKQSFRSYNQDETYKRQGDRNHSTEDRPVEERRTVFVGSLERNISRSRLKYLFSKFGTVMEVRLHRNADGSRYGFVTYQSTREACLAVESASRYPDYRIAFGARKVSCKRGYADYDGMEAVRRNEDKSFEQMLVEAKKEIANKKWKRIMKNDDYSSD